MVALPQSPYFTFHSAYIKCKICYFNIWVHGEKLSVILCIPFKNYKLTTVKIHNDHLEPDQVHVSSSVLGQDN